MSTTDSNLENTLDETIEPLTIAEVPPLALAGNTAVAPPAATEAESKDWKPGKEPLVAVPAQMFCSVACAT